MVGNLANALQEQGERAEAHVMCTQVIEAQLRVLGREHLRTVLSHCKQFGKLTERSRNAVKSLGQKPTQTMFVEVLCGSALGGCSTGPEHPETTSTAKHLAGALSNQGKHD